MQKVTSLSVFLKELVICIIKLAPSPKNKWDELHWTKAHHYIQKAIYLQQEINVKKSYNIAWH